MSDYTDLNSNVEECHALAVKKGWYDPGNPRSLPELLCLVHSEVSEVLEEYRNGHTPTEIYYGSDGKPEGIPIELADIIIRVFDLAGACGIDLGNAYDIKMAYNETRPYRHGGKKV